ncbi:MAG: S8 family serine peptidase, partial [Thermoleophilaceae bacterium]|nr:S8 family serine peptidase [Thermoleophilaceae bacterium]
MRPFTIARVRVVVAAVAVPFALSVPVVSAEAGVVVGYQPGTTTHERAEVAAAAGGSRTRSVVGLMADRVEPLHGSDQSELITRLRMDDRVRYAELDGQMDAHGSPRYPDDSYFGDQWGLANSADHDIDAPYGWQSKTSCSKVAVLDTGVDVNHPDLVNNLWHNSKEIENNGKDDDGNGYVDDYFGVNVRVGSGSGIDNDGHGTHVAGIIGASGNNAMGVTGVCWKGSVM